MNYHKSIAGGVCAIASGAWGVMAAFFSLIAALMFGYFNIARMPSMYQMPRDMTAVMTIVYLVWAVLAAALAAVNIVGGIQALKHRKWGLSLAGAVTAIFTFFPTGIAAVVLLAMAKGEFGPEAPLSPPSTTVAPAAFPSLPPTNPAPPAP